MNHKKLLSEFKLLEKDYNKLKKELQNANIFKSKKNNYLKEDKESFKIIWEKYITIFTRLKKLINKSDYIKYIFLKNYNKLVLQKYFLVFYLTILTNLLNTFGKHEKYLKVFLGENFRKDYLYFLKYIYKPKYINIINTPNILIKPFKVFISRKIYNLLDSKININTSKKLLNDFTNLNYYFKSNFVKLLTYFTKYFGNHFSHIRLSKRKKGLVKKKNIEAYLEIAKPGDIILSRGNRFMSNLGIPGFWKHTSMYLGTGKYLKENFEIDKKLKLDFKKDYIIEAKGDGINIVPINKFIKEKDYIGVFRTNFNQEKIYRSIQNSLNYIGVKYDFSFSYYSDNKMVCSELILKSYAKEFTKDEGIEIELEEIGLGITYPPNKFVGKIKKDLSNKKSKLKPVFFIDSNIKTKDNFVSTTEEFLKSGERPRISLFLK